MEEEELKIKLHFFRPYITKSVSIKESNDLDALLLKYQKQPGFVYMQDINNNATILRFNDIKDEQFLVLNDTSTLNDLYDRIDALESTINTLNNTISDLQNEIDNLKS